MTDLKQFIKQEAVAIIAFIAALVSCIFVPVTNYVSYIDTDLIGVMFGFMAVVAGFSVNNVFKVLSEQVAALAKDTRNLALALVFMVFFMSMLITNDVALIAFIPFTVMMYEKIDKSPVYVIALQTVAANMGSAFTPFGNPQNLYLFSAVRSFFGSCNTPVPLEVLHFLFPIPQFFLMPLQMLQISPLPCPPFMLFSFCQYYKYLLPFSQFDFVIP